MDCLRAATICYDNFQKERKKERKKESKKERK